MKRLSILGSTGSIGTNALRIVEMFPERFAVKALAAKTSTAILADQIAQFHPNIAVVFDESRAIELRNRLSGRHKTEILFGTDGYTAAATLDDVDEVVSAMVGAAGLIPTLKAIEAGKQLALANKETLVMAGEIVMRRAAQKNVQIIPVDSEHSAVFQCLSGNRREDLSRVILTGSGGPFLTLPLESMARVTPQDALKHPTWRMGKKISIDSATMMNKGLEVIEAKWLFDLRPDMIDVVIHPQSVVHSMVCFKDGTVMAQLGIPDMKGAIAYALSHPERLPLNQPFPDFPKIGSLAFSSPNLQKFPCLALARYACETGGTLPAVLNAANEVAVDAFLTHRIAFVAIPEIVGQTLNDHQIVTHPDLSDVLEADRWARQRAEEHMGGYGMAKLKR